MITCSDISSLGTFHTEFMALSQAQLTEYSIGDK